MVIGIIFEVELGYDFIFLWVVVLIDLEKVGFSLESVLVSVDYWWDGCYVNLNFSGKIMSMGIWF